MTMLKGMQCLRFMDWFNTNNNPYFSFDQIKQPSHADRTSTGGVSLSVVSISAPDPSLLAPGYSTNYSLVIQVTTATPHGLFNGAQCFTTSNFGNVTTTNGTVINLDAKINSFAPAMLWVVDETNLIFYTQVYPPQPD